MFASPKKAVIESNIPSAQPGKYNSKTPIKRSREMEDVTVWMEMQEEAELEFLFSEFAGKDNRQFRSDYLFD
jgi:hypothetical protein